MTLTHCIYLLRFFNSKTVISKKNQFLLFAIAYFLLIQISQLVAQPKRLVAIGSSTTAGTGASVMDSSWVSLLERYYKCQLRLIDTAYNLGLGGADPYNAMPTSYVPPVGRATPDSNVNVSKACFLLEDLANSANGSVIVNFPSNQYIEYSIAEILNCLQTIYDSLIFQGYTCFITTTQPRTDDAFNTPLVKKKLTDIKDSIIKRFGLAKTLNFWDGMVNPADSSILAKYSSGDLIHFNNAGHRALFEKVVAKNIFKLPVWYSKATGTLEKLSTWGSNPDGSGSNPTSFIADNQLFYIVNNSMPTIAANWTLSGINTRLNVGNGIQPLKLMIPKNLKLIINNPVINNCY